MAERSVGLVWVDNWADVILDSAGEVRHLPVELVDAATGREANVADGWSRETIPTHWRTRTIVVGAQVAGGLVNEPVITADGARRSWDLIQEVGEVVSLTVGGAATEIGSSSADPWYLGPEKFTLNAAAAPVRGTRIEFSYIGVSPLVAAAEDADAINRYGRFERLLEDDSLDTIALVQERASREQVRHGQPGLEIVAECKPADLPLFHDVGGSPQVSLGSTGQRMLVEKLKTGWLPGGDRVVQGVTLRAHDYRSDLDVWARERRLTSPPQIVQPVVRPISVVAVEGLALPVDLGGVYEYFDSSTDWVPVPGAINPVLDGHLLGDTRLVLSFMASMWDWQGGQQGNVRLWDYTRRVRIGSEIAVTGAGELWRQLTGLQLPARRVQVGLQQRVLATGGELAVWGGKLSAGALTGGLGA